jgi:uncharacterized protein (DUF779 family)
MGTAEIGMKNEKVQEEIKSQNFFKAFYMRGGVCCQGCQMVCFPTKNTNLGKFWRALDWKM